MCVLATATARLARLGAQPLVQARDDELEEVERAVDVERLTEGRTAGACLGDALGAGQVDELQL